MILRQFLHNGLVGDIRPYLRAAENAGMRIHFVIDTHVRAGHRSAGRALAKAAGAAYVLSGANRRAAFGLCWN